MEARPPRFSRFKTFVFSLLPLALLILVAEGSVRLLRFDQPTMKSPFVTPGFESIHRDDDDLFFSLRPDLAAVLQVNLHAVTDTITHHPGDIDFSGRGKRFDAGRHVDAIAIDIVAINHDVAQVDADAKLDWPLRCGVAMALDHLLLNRHRALERIHDTAEFHQDAVSHELHHPAVVGLDEGFDQLAAQRLEPGQGTGLILPHQTAVADDVRHQNGGKLSGWAGFHAA